MKLTKLSDIIPLVKEGKTDREIGQMLRPSRSHQTILRYRRRLEEAGFDIKKPKMGRPKMEL